MPFGAGSPRSSIPGPLLPLNLLPRPQRPYTTLLPNSGHAQRQPQRAGSIRRETSLAFPAALSRVELSCHKDLSAQRNAPRPTELPRLHPPTFTLYSSSSPSTSFTPPVAAPARNPAHALPSTPAHEDR